MSDLYLFRSSLKDLFRTKTLIATVLLALLPCALLALQKYKGSDYHAEIAYDSLVTLMVFGFIMAIVAVVYFTGVIVQELEQKTIVYLLTRPIPRWRILLAKFAAAFLATTVTVWLATFLLALVAFGPSKLGDSRLGRDLLILPVGVLAYGALFLLLATLLNRPLIYGLLFAFGWETWAPLMPGNFQRLSLASYLRVLAPHPKPEDMQGASVDSMMAALNPHTITNTMAWQAMIGVIVVALVLAILVFSTREYVPRDDAE